MQSCIGLVYKVPAEIRAAVVSKAETLPVASPTGVLCAPTSAEYDGRSLSSVSAL